MAIMGRDKEKASYEIAKAMLQHGARVNDAGQTALMIVAGTSNESRVRCVQLFCKHGASVDLEDKVGRTALRYVEKWGGHEGCEDVKRTLQSYSQNGFESSSFSSTWQSSKPCVFD